MASVIDGKSISKKILEEICAEVKFCDRAPCAVFVKVGENPASAIYVRQKQKIAASVGIETRVLEFQKDVALGLILDEICRLNADDTVDGILVQAPLPSAEMQKIVFSTIDPSKDIDGFHTLNIGLLCQEQEGFLPCTPAGIIELIKSTKENIAGKHVVILGRSLIVGKPVGLLLLQNKEFANATVTFCHSQTQNLKQYTSTADILVSAMGKPSFVTKEMVKPGALVIDVGINRVPDASSPRGYKIVGDVDFENVEKIAGYITPVPGGVGPMTIAMLMKNTLIAYKKHVSNSRSFSFCTH